MILLRGRNRFGTIKEEHDAENVSFLSARGGEGNLQTVCGNDAHCHVILASADGTVLPWGSIGPIMDGALRCHAFASYP